MFISVEKKNNVTLVNVGFPMTIEDKIDLIRKSANINISKESILASFDAFSMGLESLWRDEESGYFVLVEKGQEMVLKIYPIGDSNQQSYIK